MQPYDEVKFWLQVTTDAERTLVCSPDLESRLKSQIEARGLSGQFTVHVSPLLKDNHIYVIDHHAIEASTREMLAQSPVTFGQEREGWWRTT